MLLPQAAKPQRVDQLAAGMALLADLENLDVLHRLPSFGCSNDRLKILQRLRPVRSQPGIGTYWSRYVRPAESFCPHDVRQAKKAIENSQTKKASIATDKPTVTQRSGERAKARSIGAESIPYRLAREVRGTS